MERFDGHIMFTCGNNIIIYFFLITEQPTLPRLEIEPIFPFVLMKKFANLDPIFFFFRLSICVRHIIALCNRLKNYFINASYYYYWWLVIIIVVDTNICNSANKCVFYWVFFLQTYWTRLDDQPLTREFLMMMLADLDLILIRAVYSYPTTYAV